MSDPTPRSSGAERRTLRDYVMHKGVCASIRFRVNGPCDCGLDALLASPSSEAGTDAEAVIEACAAYLERNYAGEPFAGEAVEALRTQAWGPILRATKSEAGTRERETGWQPIETAPKDGTLIIGARFAHGRVRIHEMRHNGLAFYSDGGASMPPMTHWMPAHPPQTERKAGCDRCEPKLALKCHHEGCQRYDRHDRRPPQTEKTP